MLQLAVQTDIKQKTRFNIYNKWLSFISYWYHHLTTFDQQHEQILYKTCSTECHEREGHTEQKRFQGSKLHISINLTSLLLSFIVLLSYFFFQQQTCFCFFHEWQSIIWGHEHHISFLFSHINVPGTLESIFSLPWWKQKVHYTYLEKYALSDPRFFSLSKQKTKIPFWPLKMNLRKHAYNEVTLPFI